MTLYRQMMKIHLPTILSYAVGSSLYLILIIGIFPAFADKAEAMNELISGMPEGFINAFGLESGMGSLGEFISGKYYELLFVIILVIYTIMMTNQLIVHYVDRGSMAYLLTTPFSRIKIALTQISIFLTGLLVITSVTAITGLLSNEFFVEEKFQMDPANFIEINLIGFLLFFAIGGYCFLLSATLNDEKVALGSAAGITLFLYGADFIGKLSENLDWMSNISIFSLFRPMEILKAESSLFLSYTVLTAIGLAGYIAALYLFKKRDLPL